VPLGTQISALQRASQRRNREGREAEPERRRLKELGYPRSGRERQRRVVPGKRRKIGVPVRQVEHLLVDYDSVHLQHGAEICR
jgi:hypothetical protein